MKKVLIITLTILVLLIGVVLTFALYGNSPFNKVKINDVYNEDENNNVGSELGDNVKSYEEDDINNTVPKEIDNSDVAPSRIETSGDAVQPPIDSLSNTGDVNDSVNEDNDTGDNENNEEHELESNIKLRADAKEILVSSGTETVCFRAETFIDTDKILLINANTVLPVATMVDDGRRSISGDELMNDNVFSCKVDIDISKENIYEYYAVIRDDQNKYASIGSNTVKIDVYAGFSEKDSFDNEEVLTAIDNLQNSDEFKSMDLDSKADATYKLLVELSENGTVDAPYSLIKNGSILFDKENYQYTFTFQSGGIVVIPLVDINELHGHE